MESQIPILVHAMPLLITVVLVHIFHDIILFSFFLTENYEMF